MEEEEDTWLDIIVEKICDDHLENSDTLKTFIKGQRCICEALAFLKDFLKEDEMKILQDAKAVWLGEYDFEQMAELKRLFQGRYETGMTDERRNALMAGICITSQFENYGPNVQHERQNSLYYFVFYLKSLGVTDDQLHPIIKNHYPEYF